MANNNNQPKAKKAGNYSEPGMHNTDEKDLSGHKKKFDRGDPTEDKADIIQGEPELKGKSNVQIPTEYAEPGIHDEDEKDAAGFKKKFDRGAPAENTSSLPMGATEPLRQYVEDTEVAEPNYVAKEHMRLKDAIKSHIAGKTEKEFLQGLIEKSSNDGWYSPMIIEIKHRLETL